MKKILLLTLAVFGNIWGITPYGGSWLVQSCPTELALSDADFSPFVNPSIHVNKNASIGASTCIKYGDTYTGNIWGIYSVKRWHTFGKVEIEQTNNIEARQDPTTNPDYTFSDRKAGTILGGGFNIKDKLWIGAGWRHEHRRLWLETTDINTFSAGLCFQSEKLSMGISATDYSTGATMVEYEYPSFLTYRALARYSFRTFDLSAGYTKPDISGEGWFTLGCVARPIDWVGIAISYTANHPTKSIGAGLSLSWKEITFMYSLSFWRQLGQIHSIGVGYDFPIKSR